MEEGVSGGSVVKNPPANAGDTGLMPGLGRSPGEGNGNPHPRSRWKWSRSVVSNSLWPHGLWPARLLCPWDFPGKSTGVGCHFLLQRIFSTQGSNLGVPHCKQTLYCLSHQVVPSCSPGDPKMSDMTWQLKNNSGRSLSTWLKTSPS